MASKESRKRRRRPVKLPSVYRYMALGFLLPILVFSGMVLGYNYGKPYGDFSATLFAALGSIAGLIIASTMIVEIALFWDRKILRQTKARKSS
ncbi:MAG: hypothetical protein WED04_04890 [Promethearchaeati archaeon SRVP18_Atabeyarchaeia-1]